LKNSLSFSFHLQFFHCYKYPFFFYWEHYFLIEKLVRANDPLIYIGDRREYTKTSTIEIFFSPADIRGGKLLLANRLGALASELSPSPLRGGGGQFLALPSRVGPVRGASLTGKGPLGI